MKTVRSDYLKKFKCLLTKEDIKAIAQSLGRSESAVNAVFWTRPHAATEIEVLKAAQERASELATSLDRVLFELEPFNLSIEEYHRQKGLHLWKLKEGYSLYTGAYILAVKEEINNVSEALEWARIMHPQLLNHKYYLLEFLIHLLNLKSDEAINAIRAFHRQLLNKG